MQDIRIEKILDSLSKSNFRSKFHLKQKDKDYIQEKGIELNEKQKDYIINVIMSWIDREMKNNQKKIKRWRDNESIKFNRTICSIN